MLWQLLMLGIFRKPSMPLTCLSGQISKMTKVRSSRQQVLPYHAQQLTDTGRVWLCSRSLSDEEPYKLHAEAPIKEFVLELTSLRQHRRPLPNTAFQSHNCFVLFFFKSYQICILLICIQLSIANTHGL